MHTLHSIMSPRRRNNNSQKSQMRRRPNLGLAHRSRNRTLILDRVELIVETKQKPTPKLIPDPHKYNRDLRRQTLTRFTVLESLFTDTRSFKNPCKNAHVPSKRFLPASWLPPDQGKKVFPRTAEFSIVADPLRYEMQPSPTVLCRKGGMREMRKRIASPPTIRLKSESGYTAFGHSDSIQANKSQVIIVCMRTPGISAPPQYCCISHCSSWWSVWGGEIIVWAFHTTVGRRWIDGPTNHNVLPWKPSFLLCYLRSRTPALMSTHPARKLSFAHFDYPAGPCSLCSTELISILHLEDILPRDLDQILSSCQNTICVDHNGSIKYLNSPRPPSQLELHHLIQQLRLKPYSLEISPNFKASKILARNMISCATAAGLERKA